MIFMNKKNMRRMSILVTAQTAKNLERLAAMSGYFEIGRVVDKLDQRENDFSPVRERRWP